MASRYHTAPYYIGIDPGTAKCGFAVLTAEGLCLYRQVVDVGQLETALAALVAKYHPCLLILGDRTGSGAVRRRLEAMTSQVFSSGTTAAVEEGAAAKQPVVAIAQVDEHQSSMEGRRLYLLTNRKGWRRFVPLGLQTPPEPYDHFVAEVLARRYLQMIEQP